METKSANKLEKSGRPLLWVPINDNFKHWEPLKIKVYESSRR